MSDKVNTEAVLPTAQVQTAKMSNEEILKQVEVYIANAEASLASVNEQIEKGTNQLNELQKMRLMILGQRGLVLDLRSKIVGTPENQEPQSTK